MIYCNPDRDGCEYDGYHVCNGVRGTQFQMKFALKTYIN